MSGCCVGIQNVWRPLMDDISSSDSDAFPPLIHGFNQGWYGPMSVDRREALPSERRAISDSCNCVMICLKDSQEEWTLVCQIFDG